MDWGAIKRQKRSYFAGAKLAMTSSSVVDAFAALKNIYSAFRIEGPQVHLSEDVVVCLTVEVTGDSPINETLRGSH